VPPLLQVRVLRALGSALVDHGRVGTPRPQREVPDVDRVQRPDEERELDDPVEDRLAYVVL